MAAPSVQLTQAVSDDANNAQMRLTNVLSYVENEQRLPDRELPALESSTNANTDGIALLLRYIND